MAYKSKGPRLRGLEESETFSSFERWKGTLENYLGFTEFLDENFIWKPKGVCQNRSLIEIKLEDGNIISASKRARL